MRLSKLLAASGGTSISRCITISITGKKRVNTFPQNGGSGLGVSSPINRSKVNTSWKSTYYSATSIIRKFRHDANGTVSNGS